MVFLDTMSCMSNFVKNSLAFIEANGWEHSIINEAFLVLNLPGQPFTVYDEQKQLSTLSIADIYDRILLRSLEEMGLGLDEVELTFLSFGLGALVATHLVLNFGESALLVKKFISFNGIFKVDGRIKRGIGDLAFSLQSSNDSVHAKLLDIVNNCKPSSLRLESW